VRSRRGDTGRGRRHRLLADARVFVLPLPRRRRGGDRRRRRQPEVGEYQGGVETGRVEIGVHDHVHVPARVHVARDTGQPDATLSGDRGNLHPKDREGGVDPAYRFRGGGGLAEALQEAGVGRRGAGQGDREDGQVTRTHRHTSGGG